MSSRNRIIPPGIRTSIAALITLTIAVVIYFSASPLSVQSAGNPSVVVNKYFNSGTTADVVELLVIQDNLDMRGMIIKDFSGNMANDNGGKYQFSNNSLWSSVRSGTLIVLRNDNSAADTTVGGADYNLDLGLQNATYFSSLGGTFDIATTDMVMIKAAGSSDAGVTGSIHALAGGTAGAQFTAAAAPKLIASGTSPGGQFVFANNSTQSINDFDGTDATGGATGLTFGAGNNANNTAYINSLRNSGGITISINDVTKAEGNAGTTTFSFVVSLSSPAQAGGVTFDIATQDNTATIADNDYVLRSLTGQTIPQGSSSYNFDVTVNGDTTTEPNETFFVNISNIVGANAGDTQGQGTINNDDVTLVGICQIQGSGTTSPFAGQNITTSGVVTGFKSGSSGGFYIQDDACDTDSATSNGIFVFTGGTFPAAAVIGNSVLVQGTVQEFIPSADTHQKPLTEISSSPTTTLLTTGNTLPAPVTITASDTQAAGLENLERLEGMRVQVGSLTVVGPTQGSITESSATVSSTGVFFGVVTGVARPFREAGISISDPLSSGAPANVPRFDENPERIRVDSDAQPGTTALDVAAGTVITNLVGEMDYSFRAWTILPEAANPPTVGAQPGSVPAPVPNANELTIASFNMERFFDTTNDPNNPNDPVLTTTAFNKRLSKASQIIRNVQKLPDVIGVEEMENISTLQAVAAQVNSDVVNIDGGTNPDYHAYLVEGNDIGGIDVGFLVKESRVTTISITQIELPGCDHVTASTCYNYTDPNTGALDILNDRPPLVLQASIPSQAGGTFAFTVIVNHTRSLSGIDDNTVAGAGTVGARVREKRRKQAEFLANYIQNRQTADPAEKIISVGDMNAFRVNDGYVDVIGTILGTPAPPDQVVLASSDLVNPDLTDLLDILPATQQYSYNFDGNAQTLDHIIVNRRAFVFVDRFAYARNDSDFPVKDYESTNELRLSDHDQPVAYFNLAIPPTAAPVSLSGRVVSNEGAPLAGVVMRLEGSKAYATITDSDGHYSFNAIEPGEFYSLTPSRANFSFDPPGRTFNLVGSRTDAVFTARAEAETMNPLDMPEYFVRQQYLDFLGREPDEGGLYFWTAKIKACSADAVCIRNEHINISAAFFMSDEFQERGFYVYRLSKVALGGLPDYSRFMQDSRSMATGGETESSREAFAESFVQQPEFIQRYPQALGGSAFVDALLQSVQLNSGIDLSLERNALIDDFNAQGSRARILRLVAENGSFVNAEYNRAFVLMEYFGYLRRNPDNTGYDFWLEVLNDRVPGNYRGMVCAFLSSGEYQRRFGSIVSHSNGECS